jgi:hypothetical protein
LPEAIAKEHGIGFVKLEGASPSEITLDEGPTEWQFSGQLGSELERNVWKQTPGTPEKPKPTHRIRFNHDQAARRAEGAEPTPRETVPRRRSKHEKDAP